MTESYYRRRVLLFLAALAVLRVLYILYVPFDLSPDEAHYWEWSRRLGLSYYSKGPGVAYVIALFTGALGNNELGVRTGAVVFSTLGSYLMYILGRDLFKSPRTGAWAAVLPNLTPVFSIGSVLMTTDVLFLFFWAGAVYFVKNAVDRAEGRWWYAAGAMAGLGFLCKYTMVLLFPSVLLFLAFSERDRAWLRRVEPYAAAFVSLVLSTPVIVWNLLHKGVTIRHTIGQAHVENPSFSIKDVLEFAGSQAGLLGPLIFVGVVYGVWRAGRTGFREKNSRLLLAVFTSAPIFLFFLLKSFHGKVQANWAVAAYVTAFPAAAWAFEGVYEKARPAGKKALTALLVLAVASGVFLSASAYLPWILESMGMRHVIDRAPFNRVTGWAELGQKVSEVKKEMDGQGRTFVISDTYQISSELAIYTRGNPVVYNVNTGSRRQNQYDLWPGFEGLLGWNAVYVKGGDADIDPVVERAFDTCSKEVFTAYMGARRLKDYTVFRCYGFHGMEEPAPDELRY